MNFSNNIIAKDAFSFLLLSFPPTVNGPGVESIKKYKSVLFDQHYLYFHLRTPRGVKMSFPPVFSYCERYCSFSLCSRGNKITT